MTQPVALLLDRIRGTIARDPDAPALLGPATITYRNLRALIGSTMNGLEKSGVRPGQVVALAMGQTPLHLVTFLALARMGAISVSVPGIGREQERAELYRSFGVTAVVSDSESMGAPGIPLILARGVRARGDEDGLDSWPFAPAPETPMRIGLTSGTVGVRKGVEQSHDEFARRLDRRFYGDEPRPRVIPPSLHITASLTIACHALAKGGSVVFPPSYEGAPLFATILRFGVTHMIMPPAHMALLLPLLQGGAPAFPSLTHLRLLGATPSVALLDEVRRKVTPNIYVPYATTEMGVISIATPKILAAAPASSGPVAPDAQVEVVGEDGSVLAPGTPGELLVRVPAMPRGYYGDAEPERFRDGWFHSRDLGYIGSDGLLYVQGRIDDVINVGGRKVLPSYAEKILEEQAGVREAAIFPMDALSVAALVVANGPIDWGALDVFAKQRLGIFAPHRYYEVGALPRNAMGKVRRPELMRLAATDAARLRHPLRPSRVAP